MKKHLFTDINLGTEVSPTSLKFVQDGEMERTVALLKALMGSPATVIIIEGCVVSNVSTAYSVTAGKVFYNNEYITVDAFNGTSSAGSVPVFQTVSSDFTGQPKQRHGDNTLKDVLATRKLSITMAAAGTLLGTVSTATRIPDITRKNYSQTDWVVDSTINSLNSRFSGELFAFLIKTGNVVHFVANLQVTITNDAAMNGSGGEPITFTVNTPFKSTGLFMGNGVGGKNASYTMTATITRDLFDDTKVIFNVKSSGSVTNGDVITLTCVGMFTV